jgi:hypothetical protein
LSATLQHKAPGAFMSVVPQNKELNAESVTAIATGFLKRIGHKGGLKPKRVTLEEEVYTVEVEMKKLTALVRVDPKTHEIREYEIQVKNEETPFISISPKVILIIFGVSALVHVTLYFALKTFGL